MGYILWLVIVLIAMIWMWPTLWAYHVQYRVECELAFPRHECNVGEGVPLTVTLINRSFLPLPFAEVHIELPAGLSLLPDAALHHLSFATYVLMRRRVQIEFTVYGFARGPAAIHDLHVRLHEGLGIRDIYVYHQSAAQIGVRPEPESVAKRLPATDWQGQQALDRWLFPDETMFKGVRPYQQGDPLRHIDWRASARLGEWMSRQFFSSFDLDVLLLLNAQTTEPYWAGTARSPFEQLCRQLTAAAMQLERANARLQFGTNAVIARQGAALQMTQMKSQSIRSLLAHANAYAGQPLTALLQQIVRRRQALPSHILLFSAFETGEQQALLNQFTKSGKQVHIVRPHATAVGETSASPTAQESEAK